MESNDETRVRTHLRRAGISHQVEVKDDSSLVTNDDKNLVEHNEQFTDLLRLYVSNYRDYSEAKNKSRKSVFIISILILVFVTALLIVAVVISFFMLSSNKTEMELSLLSTLGAAIISLVSAYITIPKIIVEYLFNKEEEKNLADIVGKIQDYDNKIRDRR